MARFADRLIFDTDAGAIRDGEIRYFMFRADVFTTMVASLEPAHVAAVVDAFAAAVRERGRRSLEKYLRELKAANEDESALAETIMRAAPSLGWGVWTLEQVENGFDLTVVDSQIAETGRHHLIVLAIVGKAQVYRGNQLFLIDYFRIVRVTTEAGNHHGSQRYRGNHISGF